MSYESQLEALLSKGTSVTKQEVISLFDEYLAQIPSDISGTYGAVFYSGVAGTTPNSPHTGALAQALADAAKANGKPIAYIGGTQVGKLLDDPKFRKALTNAVGLSEAAKIIDGVPGTSNYGLWGATSEKLASQVNGKVVIIAPNGSTGKILSDIEIPALLNNASVDMINGSHASDYKDLYQKFEHDFGVQRARSEVLDVLKGKSAFDLMSTNLKFESLGKLPDTGRELFAASGFSEFFKHSGLNIPDTISLGTGGGWRSIHDLVARYGDDAIVSMGRGTNWLKGATPYLGPLGDLLDGSLSAYNAYQKWKAGDFAGARAEISGFFGSFAGGEFGALGGAALATAIGASGPVGLLLALGFAVAGGVGGEKAGRWLSDHLGEIIDGFGSLLDDVASFFERAHQNQARRLIDPIVLDLDGNGISLTDRQTSNVYFDMDGDGIKELTGWIGATEGLLAIDLNNNGKIDNIGELVGDLGKSGFTKLSAFNLNGGNVIDVNDAIFSLLRIWVDANSNGVTDPGELKTLTEMGIKSIDLNYTTVNFVAEGNRIHEQSIFEWVDGHTGMVVDAWFDVSNFITKSGTGETGNSTVDALPDLNGYGDVKALRLAMIADASLASIISSIVSRQTSQLGGLRSLVELALYKWAQTEGVAVDSRGSNFDGRKLATLEAFMGTHFFGNNTPNPLPAAVADLNHAWSGLVDGVMARLLINGQFSSLLSEDVAFVSSVDRIISIGSGQTLLKHLSAASPSASALETADYWAAGLIIARQALQESGTDITSEEYKSLEESALHSFGLAPFVNIIADGVVVPASGESTLTRNGLYRGSANNDNIILTNTLQAFYGQDGDDRIAVSNTSYYTQFLLDGGNGNDYLQGGFGNDWLDGGAGTDAMIGGAGDDTYVVDSVDDRIVEADGGGIETVRASITYVLSDPLNNLILTGGNINGTGNASDNELTGSSGNNILYGLEEDDLLDGGAGDDTMYGGQGYDTYIVDSAGDVVFEEGTGYDVVRASVDYTLGNRVERLELTGTALRANGNSLNNVLIGNDQNNTLNGWRGGDSMYGEAGDDLYYVDDTGDRAYESANEGTDSVRSTVDFDLGSNVENLTLIGTADIDGGGNDLANAITGNDGDNLLDGGAGADKLSGRAGDDTYVIDDAGDKVIEAGDGGIDTIYTTLSATTLASTIENLRLYAWSYDSTARNGTGNAANNEIEGNNGANLIRGMDGNDQLYGYGGADNLFGDGGDDLMDGGLGIDIMKGSIGNDSYFVDNAGDQVIEAASGGSDTVYASISYILGSQVESLVLTGSADIDGQGNGLNNTIGGNDWDNALDGGLGADTLAGLGGDDTYTVDQAGDVVIEEFNFGRDTVRSAISFTLTANFENLTLLGTANLTGDGNASRNELIGNAGNNVLRAYAGSDWLDGGAGLDTLYGGSGSDTYVVDNTGDVIVEEGSDTDTVYASRNYVLGNKLENLYLTGPALNGTGNALNNAIFGNALNNVLDGGEGNDDLRGGTGNDTYMVDSTNDYVTEYASEGIDTVITTADYWLGSAEVENLILTGSADIDGYGSQGNNSLTGNDADNYLDGRGGADTLTGGKGDDTYVVDNAGDVVVEAAGAGTDWVATSLSSYVLGAALDNLQLYNGYIDSVVRNGTGNALNNRIVGSDGANTISGLDGDDQLTGNDGNDTLDGGNGNDWLDGGAGNDSLTGGAGNDTYVVGATGDVVVEAAGGGTDTVRSAVSYLMSSNLENLVLTGTAAIDGQGNGNNNTLTGNEANNSLDGGTGADVMIGGGGNDTYTVDNTGDLILEIFSGGVDTVRSSVSYSLDLTVEKLILLGTAALNGTGNIYNNSLTGNSGANILDGQGGNDVMDGGAGNDTYIVEQVNDTVTEAAGGGNDRVIASVSYTLSANVERLNLGGTANLDGTGNELANLLVGNAGANRLDGKAGADVMQGGAGDDSYFVDDAGDVVDELDGGGTDLVSAAVSYALQAGSIENLTLTGTAANATGNALNNVLTGTSGINALDGAGGNDILIGGAGADVFLFRAGSGKDTINDFKASQNDTINLNDYSHGTVNGGGITISQSGTNTLIDLGGGNLITVLATTASDAAFLSHIVW